MDYLKTTWKKDKKEVTIPKEVLDRMGARGSFVTVKSDRIFRDLNEKPEFKQRFGSELSISDQINLKTAEIYYKMWIDNLTENIDIVRNSECVSELPKTKKKTAIVVGAGPSLRNKNHMKHLKNVGNKVIISTDRMLIPLLENGITPEYVVSVDGQTSITNYYDSPLIDKNISTKAILAVTVAPSVVKKFSGKKYFYTPMVDDVDIPISATNTISYLTNTSVIDSGGNVGITCINVGYYLGFKNIICTGLDLGFPTPEDVRRSQHYKAVADEDPDVTFEKYMDLYVIKGFNPDFNVKYYTDLSWQTQIESVLSRAKTMEKEGINLINSTEAGALHGHGIIGLPLSEALKKYE